MKRLFVLLGKEFDARTLFFLAGLVLASAGAYQVYAPAGFLTAGGVLLWWTVPSRPPFVSKPRPPKGD